MDRNEFISILNSDNTIECFDILVKDYCTINNKDYNKAIQILEFIAKSSIFGGPIYNQLFTALVEYYKNKYTVCSVSLNNKVLIYY